MATIHLTDTTRRNPADGTEALAVESCREMPIDENGDANPDKAVYSRFIVLTEVMADLMAQQLLVHDAHGEVRIEPVVWERYERSHHAGRWVPNGEPRFVSDVEAETAHRVADAIEQGE